MPPIPLHKDAPIKATATGENPSAQSPQTADIPPPTRTVPARTTATTDDASNPPAPQPGARPIPPTAAAFQPASNTTPPAPQPGYTATHTTTVTHLDAAAAPPPQFTIPPPTDSQLAGRSTATATTASNNKPGPTTLNLGPVQSPFQAEHSQGSNAAPTGANASGQERTSFEHPPGYAQAPDNNSSYAGPSDGGAGEGGVGGAAWNVLAKAGEALKKGEEAAWKAVRNK